MKKLLGLLMIIALFSSCKETKKDTTTTVPTEVTKPEVKLYTLDGGSVQVNKLEMFSLDTVYRGQSAKLPSPYYVISHPKGNLMWDAGITEDLIDAALPADATQDFIFSRNKHTVDQLKSIGMTLDDIKYIALSHWHNDHTGHANLLKNSTWLVQDIEYNLINSDEFKKDNMERYNEVKELTKVQKLHGDHDVFGDGSVVIKLMPGHTPGHQVLYIDLPEHGPVLLSGDLYHLKENRKHRRIPVFNIDVDATLKSMDVFEVFVKEKNADVFVQHDMEDYQRMPKSPQYLK